ncbi:MAG: hypothetical protein MUF85_03730 [Patescibacteria group bacterium]|jgi:hypothetical protein|nr:hypothetical protein [Patescibacteria group bacterium]
MANGNKYPDNPGSLADFCRYHGHEAESPTDPGCLKEYLGRVAAFRDALAEHHGVTPDDLHSMHFDRDPEELVA